MANEISNKVYASREQIRNQIISYMQSYLELENVDLAKSSFVSFLINVLSSLTSNLLFYQLSTYREFFLTSAQLPESILNLSSFLGYNSQNATPAVTNALLTIPLTFTSSPATITIPSGFKFSTSDACYFTTYYITIITITNNTTVSIKIQNGNQRYDLPYNIDTAENTLSFVLPLKQVVSNVQEFSLDQDIQIYQFVTLDIPLTNQSAGLTVQVQSPGSSSWTTYEEFTSLYLMSNLSYGFVQRRTSTGIRLYFGNGLIGIQPAPGSKIRVTVQETKGDDGNIIAGALRSGERLYVPLYSGGYEIVNYTVLNASPAVNGVDQESIDEVRRNAISGLTTLGKLSSESDFSHVSEVSNNSNIIKSLPILKRSDIKNNEILIFTVLNFLNEIVPTRNLYASVDDSTTYIPRGTTFNFDDEDYLTIFDMNLDTINYSALYSYIMYEIQQIPSLITSYGSSYNITADNLLVQRSGSSALFQLTYKSDELDSYLTECTLENAYSGITYNMTNDATSSFTYTFSDYTIIPEGENTYYFNISKGGSNIAKYSSTFTFRKNLNNFMMSNLTTDSTAITIYDIPVIKKSYYNSINQRDFELLVLQNLLDTINFSQYKMLTDFLNLKFSNTTGNLYSMTYNKQTKLPVIDFRSSPPTFPTLNDRYIVKDGVGDWLNKDGQIAQCTDETSMTWIYIIPFTDDIVEVLNSNRKYVYTETGWFYPILTNPLEIEIEVYKSSTYTGTATELANNISLTILENYQDRFGINTKIFKSELINTVQDVDGVEHCRIIKPVTSIFFNFDIKEFTQDELLKYGPEYIYFTASNISIKVI